MLADFYIPRLSNDMKVAVLKNNFRGKILAMLKNGVTKNVEICKKKFLKIIIFLYHVSILSN